MKMSIAHRKLLKGIYDTHGVWKAKVRLDRTHDSEIDRINWEVDTLAMLSDLEDAGLLTRQSSGVTRSWRMGERVTEEFISDRSITQEGIYAAMEGDA